MGSELRTEREVLNLDHVAPPHVVRQPRVGLVGDASAVVAVVAVILALATAAAVLGGRPAWLAAGAVAIGLGLLARRSEVHLLVFAALPATLLTGSAFVPADGRYIPAMVVFAAIIVATLDRWRHLVSVAAGLPRGLLLVVGGYLLWSIPVSIASVAPLMGLEYIVGMVASILVAMVITPVVLANEKLRRQFLAAVAVLGLAFVGVGFLLFAVRGLDLYGKDVGLYFIGELMLFGKTTGIVFPQNYGPFIGPSTEILAFAITASVYLALSTQDRARLGWLLAALVCLLGLISTFSREGLLMAGLGVGLIYVATLIRRRASLLGLGLTLAMTAVCISAMTGWMGIAGRLDLVASWYGNQAVSILMNPSVPDRGEEAAGVPTIVVPGSTGGTGGSGGQGTNPPVVDPNTYPAIINLKTTSSFEARVGLWKAAIAAAAVRPVFGYGLGTDADAIVPYLVGPDARLQGATTHSTPLRILVEMGIPGLLLYVGFLLVAARLALRQILRGEMTAALALAGCVTAILFHQFIGTLLLGGLSIGSYFFAVAIGLLAIRVSPIQEPLAQPGGADGVL